MQNSIELHLSTQSFSIPSESMKAQHIMQAISILQKELFYLIPDHMYQTAEDALLDNLYETVKEQNQQDDVDDLPF